MGPLLRPPCCICSHPWASTPTVGPRSRCVRVPAVRTWNPIDAPAAGRGVVPDLDVRETRADWLAGRDRVLERALAETRASP